MSTDLQLKERFNLIAYLNQFRNDGVKLYDPEKTKGQVIAGKKGSKKNPTPFQDRAGWIKTHLFSANNIDGAIEIDGVAELNALRDMSMLPLWYSSLWSLKHGQYQGQESAFIEDQLKFLAGLDAAVQKDFEPILISVRAYLSKRHKNLTEKPGWIDEHFLRIARSVKDTIDLMVSDLLSWEYAKAPIEGRSHFLYALKQHLEYISEGETDKSSITMAYSWIEMKDVENATGGQQSLPENKLTLRQIAVILAFEGKVLRKDGEANKIAKDNGHNSGEKLHNLWSSYSTMPKRTRGDDETKVKKRIELFEGILSYLTDNAKTKAKDEIEILNRKVQ